MNALSTRTKLMISLSVVLFGLFLFFLFAESQRGKSFVMVPPTDEAQATDDEPVGLHPIMYCAVPSGVLLLLSFVSYKADRRRVGE
jgi:hypothetical protein